MLYGLKTGLEPFLFFMPAILVISAKNASRDCPFGTAPTQTVGAPGPHPRERDCCLVPASINARGAWRCAPTGWIAIRRPCAQRTPIGNEISGSVAMPFWRCRDVVFIVPTYAGHAIGPGSAGPDRHAPLRPCPRTSLPRAGWLVLGASGHSNAKAGPGAGQ